MLSVQPEDARRALVSYLGLAERKPGALAETVACLGAVQMDPMRIVAPAHLLTLRLRRGPTSETALSRGLSGGGLFEAYLKERCLVSRRDLAAAAPHFLRARAQGLLAKRGLQDVGAQILAELGRGPRYSRQLQSPERVASFWDNNPASMKATTMAADILAYEGKVVIAGRRRGERRYDLPERLFPAWEETLAQPAEGKRAAALHYGRTMGIFRAADPYLGWADEDTSGRRALAQAMCDEGAWLELRIAGIGRGYLCCREIVPFFEAPAVRGAQLLAPLDNLLWDRARLRDVFGFAYTWEAYTPAQKRRVGPYGMPVLVDGQLVGEVDARRDGAGILRYRILPREKMRRGDLRRVERAVQRLAAGLGTDAAPAEQV